MLILPWSSTCGEPGVFQLSRLLLLFTVLYFWYTVVTNHSGTSSSSP